ncbi:MAG: hypothetical protein AAGF54_01775 [Pseudomonadota bacterium]
MKGFTMAKKTDKKSKVKKAKKAKKAELSRKREEMLRSRALEEVRGERLFSEFLESRKPAEVEASKVVETEASKVVEAETSRIIETETSKAENKGISRPVEPISIKPGKEKFASAEMLDLETNSHHTPGLVDREVDREAEAILSLYAAMGKHKDDTPSEAEAEKLNTHLLSSASYLLAVAAGLAFLFGATMFMAPGGREAVAVMGGVLEATAPETTNRWVFMLDTLFPIFFGAGLACFVAAFTTKENRPLARFALTVLVAAVLADFSENALAFQLLNGDEVFPVQFIFTSIKYAGLGLAGAITATLIDTDGNLGKVVWAALFIVFPILAALLVSGIAGAPGREIAGSFFPFILLLLAIYANRLATIQDDS